MDDLFVDIKPEIEKVKLTKTALNKFIQWSTSRYNNYCGYGNKKDNVELVYKALKEGFIKYENGTTETIFTIHCAGGVYESGTGRHWKPKKRSSGGDDYTINCETLTIEAKYSKRIIQFIN